MKEVKLDEKYLDFCDCKDKEDRKITFFFKKLLIVIKGSLKYVKKVFLKCSGCDDQEEVNDPKVKSILNGQTSKLSKKG